MTALTNYLETFLFFFAAFVLGPLFVLGWLPLLILGIIFLARKKKRAGAVLTVIGAVWGAGIIAAVWYGAVSSPGVPVP